MNNEVDNLKKELETALNKYYTLTLKYGDLIRLKNKIADDLDVLEEKNIKLKERYYRTVEEYNIFYDKLIEIKKEQIPNVFSSPLDH